MNGRLKLTASSIRGGFSPAAITAFLVAAASRSASAQISQPSGDTLRGGGICGADRIEHLMQLAGFGFPMEFHERARYFGVDIIRLDGQCAVQYRRFFSEAAKVMITEGNLLERKSIAWVEINGVLQNAHCLFLFALAAQDVSLLARKPRHRWAGSEVATSNSASAPS